MNPVGNRRLPATWQKFSALRRREDELISHGLNQRASRHSFSRQAPQHRQHKCLEIWYRHANKLPSMRAYRNAYRSHTSSAESVTTLSSVPSSTAAPDCSAATR